MQISFNLILLFQYIIQLERTIHLLNHHNLCDIKQTS